MINFPKSLPCYGENVLEITVVGQTAKIRANDPPTIYH